MASLWQQWPVTDGPDADASDTAAADGADDSPGGGCASTAETGASDAATQQPTEAEESRAGGRWFFVLSMNYHWLQIIYIYIYA